MLYIGCSGPLSANSRRNRTKASPSARVAQPAQRLDDEGGVAQPQKR
jgi:hypothetical protein